MEKTVQLPLEPTSTKDESVETTTKSICYLGCNKQELITEEMYCKTFKVQLIKMSSCLI